MWQSQQTNSMFGVLGQYTQSNSFPFKSMTGYIIPVGRPAPASFAATEILPFLQQQTSSVLQYSASIHNIIDTIGSPPPYSFYHGVSMDVWKTLHSLHYLSSSLSSSIPHSNIVEFGSGIGNLALGLFDMFPTIGSYTMTDYKQVMSGSKTYVSSAISSAFSGGLNITYSNAEIGSYSGSIFISEYSLVGENDSASLYGNYYPRFIESSSAVFIRMNFTGSQQRNEFISLLTQSFNITLYQQISEKYKQTDYWVVGLHK